MPSFQMYHEQSHVLVLQIPLWSSLEKTTCLHGKRLTLFWLLWPVYRSCIHVSPRWIYSGLNCSREGMEGWCCPWQDGHCKGEIVQGWDCLLFTLSFTPRIFPLNCLPFTRWMGKFVLVGLGLVASPIFVGCSSRSFDDNRAVPTQHLW